MLVFWQPDLAVSDTVSPHSSREEKREHRETYRSCPLESKSLPGAEQNPQQNEKDTKMVRSMFRGRSNVKESKHSQRTHDPKEHSQCFGDRVAGSSACVL